MPNPRLSAVLVAICLLAISFSNGLLPLAQALILAPTSEPADKAEGLIYDTKEQVYPVLQKAQDAFTNLVRDKKGAVDWMEALNSGAITPRADLMGTGKMETWNNDIIMKNTRGMPYVKFPHISHTRWLDCTNCHDNIFTPKARSNPVTMTKIFQGQYCGVCHGQVAFVTTAACERCHNVPQNGSKGWW